jgi:hypothetical protein
MARKSSRRRSTVGPIYLFALVWALLALNLPIYRISALLLVFAASAAMALFSRPFFQRRAAQSEPEPEPEPEPEVSHGAEIDAIIAEGKTAQKEMGRLYGSIHDATIRAKINRLMEVSDKIVQDAVHDESDVPQIKRFLNYYLPTTIKLLNAYDRMGSQGVKGENISSSMQRIEEMLDESIAAFEKQLDSLFANQALDIETDIQVMNSMMAREGLTGKDFK